MIAIVRACLCSKRASFACKSSVSSHFFSTCPRVYDLLLHKYQFSPEVASQVASDLVPPENADSILSFLKDSGCSITQLERIVKYRPRILSHNVEDIKFKIKIFQDLGLSPEDIAKLISKNQGILHLRAESKIIPSVSLLKGLLRSDNDVARLLRKSAWCISADLEKSLVPNLEFLKSVGIPMERILFLLYTYPRTLLIKPDVMRKSVEKAEEMGFDKSAKLFVHALRMIASMSKEMWQLKLQSFQEIGFSESDTLTMFKKFPPVFQVSIKKIEKVKQLLLATGKFNMSSIVNFPGLFWCSVEQRLEPRVRILEILERKNLIKMPSVATMSTLSEDKFFERFVRPYPNEVGKAFVTKSCVKEQKLD